jgi:hypothetical protein
MEQVKKYQDTLTCKTYMRVGGFWQILFRYGSNGYKGVMFSYEHPGFLYGMGNALLATGLGFSFIGIPIMFSMLKTFNKYNINGPYYLYATFFFFSIFGWLAFILESTLSKSTIQNIDKHIPVFPAYVAIILLIIFSKKLIFNRFKD